MFNKCIIVLSFLLSSKFVYSQVQVYHYNQDQSINLNIQSQNKHTIYIFIKNGDVDTETENVLSILNTSNIDYSLFNIVLLKITSVPICPPDKKIIINGYDSLPSSPLLDPHFIIVQKDNQGNLDLLMESRAGLKNDMIIKVQQKNGKLSPFYKIQNHSILKKLITINETLLLKRVNYLDSVVNKQQLYIDSVTNSKRYFTRAGKDNISIVIHTGSFLSQYKIPTYQKIKPKQSWINTPICNSLAITYYRYISEKISLGFGVDLMNFRTGVYSRNDDLYKISSNRISNQLFTVNPSNPIAISSTYHAGVNFGCSYKIPNGASNLNFVVNTSINLGKSITLSHGRFVYQTTDKTIQAVDFKDIHLNNYSLFLTINPTIQKTLNNLLDIQVGLLGRIGVSNSNPTVDYILVDAFNKYKALESVTENINLQSLGINIALLYWLR
jgi:hypothetical protein